MTAGTWTYSLASDPGQHVVRVVDPVGRVLVYRWPGAAAITANGGGSYTLTYPQGAIGEYVLTEIDDLNGSQTTEVVTGVSLSQIETAEFDFALDLPGFIGG